MHANKPKILAPLIAGFILFFLTSSLIIPHHASADVGARPILPGGSNIQPGEQTPIQMAAELVTMTVRPATDADNSAISLNPVPYGFGSQSSWYSVVADVQAEFTMHNPTTSTINLTTWFPLASSLSGLAWQLNPDEIVPAIARFQVNVNGTPLEYAVSNLPNPRGAEKPALPWASFPVSYVPGAETVIQVEYLLPLIQAVKGSQLALYYVFQTGSSWAGSIGQAELVLNLPYPASSETIADMHSGSLADLPYIMAGEGAGLPAGASFQGNQARWSWMNFEPTAQDDFSIWLLDPADWAELETLRQATRADPQNGSRWLALGNEYLKLATAAYNRPSAFFGTYLTLGIQAYQQAVALIPEHPAPHAGLALLMLANYLRESQASPALWASIREEFTLCKDLASRSPYAESSQEYCWYVGAVLSEVASPTPTAASFGYTLTPIPLSTAAPTFSPTPVSTITQSPMPIAPDPTASATPPPSSYFLGRGLSSMIILAEIAVILIIALLAIGYFLSRHTK